MSGINKERAWDKLEATYQHWKLNDLHPVPLEAWANRFYGMLDMYSYLTGAHQEEVIARLDARIHTSIRNTTPLVG